MIKRLLISVIISGSMFLIKIGKADEIYDKFKSGDFAETEKLLKKEIAEDIVCLALIKGLQFDKKMEMYYYKVSLRFYYDKDIVVKISNIKKENENE